MTADIRQQRDLVRALIVAGTYYRLAWQYGPERAWRIVLGEDAETEADLVRWRELGRVRRGG